VSTTLSKRFGEGVKLKRLVVYPERVNVALQDPKKARKPRTNVTADR
jgi:hypothetical protein